MKKRIFIIFGIITVGLCLHFIYGALVVSESEIKLEKIKRKFYVKDKAVKVNFDLSKDAYLLKVRHKISKAEDTQVLFNGIRVVPNIHPYKRIRAEFENSYIYLSKKIVNQGTNSLEIIFPGIPPEQTQILLRNYRKYSNRGTYLLFSDSSQLPCDETTFKTRILFSGLVLLLGITFLQASSNTSWAKGSFLVSRNLRLFLLTFTSLLLIPWAITFIGYRIIVTPAFFWQFIFFALIVLLVIAVYTTADNILNSLRNATKFFLVEKKFVLKTGVSFGLLIIMVNLWVCWPSFFHLFRHDEWFLFFSAKNVVADFSFVIKFFDWQLHLPYDRLMYRPVHHGSMALSRVLFDTNYIAPHIITFAKHILASFCLWWLMWEYKKRWVSGLFALLFSVLIVRIDPVIWPHLDGYIVTTLFMLLTIITFRKTVYNQISAFKGWGLIALLLFLNLLTTEIVFLMPICFFVAYWAFFRKRNEPTVKQKDVGSVFALLAPIIAWATLFAIHLYCAYPDLNMTELSESIGLCMPLLNFVRLIVVVIAGVVYPFSSISYVDKVYFNVSIIGVLWVFVLVYFGIRFRKKVFGRVTNETVFLIILTFSVLVTICFGRAAYVNMCLNNYTLPSHYTYCIVALIISAIYTLFDFDKILSNEKLRISFLLILFFLITYHSLKTHKSCKVIESQTLPLKKYYNSIKKFVNTHKNESDFSFKIIDRPPKIKMFGWYSDTCIDGLFARFINYQTPKYILEYDYDAEMLKNNLCNNTEFQNIIESENVDTFAGDADFVNSIGISFKKISYDQKSILVGVFEVAQQQWQDVMGYNPGRFKGKGRPVENVSYRMVEQFLRKLNDIEGEDIYRLPTEKEYLYLVNFYMDAYEDNKNIEKYVWLRDNADEMTHAVGQRDNMLAGIYDLIGNVWEWTSTPIHPDSPAGEFEENPRICFGRSWRDVNINTANLTTNYPPDFRHEHLGFRLVREIKSSTEKE